jgi:hypothetical protein
MCQDLRTGNSLTFIAPILQFGILKEFLDLSDTLRLFQYRFDSSALQLSNVLESAMVNKVVVIQSWISRQ